MNTMITPLLRGVRGVYFGFTIDKLRMLDFRLLVGGRNYFFPRPKG